MRSIPVLIFAPMAQAPRVSAIVSEADSATLSAAQSELQRGLGAMTGKPVPLASRLSDGAILLGKPGSSRQGAVRWLRFGP